MAKKKDYNSLIIAVVAIVAIVGLIVVFVYHSPYRGEVFVSTPNTFGQAASNNIYGNAVMPSQNEIVLPMQCSCGQGFSCTGLYTGSYVDCSCCVEELIN